MFPRPSSNASSGPSISSQLWHYLEATGKPHPAWRPAGSNPTSLGDLTQLKIWPRDPPPSPAPSSGDWTSKGHLMQGRPIHGLATIVQATCWEGFSRMDGADGPKRILPLHCGCQKGPEGSFLSSCLFLLPSLSPIPASHYCFHCYLTRIFSVPGTAQSPFCPSTCLILMTALLGGYYYYSHCFQM